MTTTVSASADVPVSFVGVARLVADDPQALLPPPPAGRPVGTFETVVELPGGTSVRQLVAAVIGDPEVTEESCVMSLEWVPTGHQQLLPAFQGTVEVVAGEDRSQSASTLRVSGDYQPPLRRAGAVADLALARRIAAPTLQALARSLARQLTERFVLGHQLGPWHPPAHPEPLRDAPTQGGHGGN